MSAFLRATSEKAKYILISILIFSLCLLTFYFQIILNIKIIYTHFFYIPIILSCLWWKYKGLIIPLGLALFLILFPVFFSYVGINIDDSFRAIIFLGIGVVISSMSTIIDKKDQEVKESQEWLSVTMKSIGDGVITTDKNGIITFVNLVAEQLTGWEEKQIFGRRLNEIFKIVNENTGKEIENPVDRVLKEGRIIGLGNDTTLIKKDGSKISIDDSGAPIKNEKGKIIGVILIFREVIENRKLQQEIKNSQENLTSILSSLKDTVFVISEDFEILFKNETASEIFGENLVGKKCYYVIKGLEHPCENCGQLKLLDKELCKIRFEQCVNTPFIDPAKYFDVLYTPIENYNGKKAIVSVFRDITENRRLEEILKDRIKELNCFFEFSKITEEKNISLEDIMKKLVEILPSAYQYPEITCALISFKGEDYKTKNFKETDWKLISDIKLKDSIIGFTEICYLEEKPQIDDDPFLKEERELINAITERLGKIIERIYAEKFLRESEENLRVLNESLEQKVEEKTRDLTMAITELKRSNAELEQFAYVASHDLQEPLRMVASFTQLLQRRYQDKLDQDANDFINYAVDGAKRMQALINDLLLFSRVGTRGNPFKATDMNVILEPVLNNLKNTIEESNAIITNDPLPVVMADDSQMIQLLQNLVANAIKFRNIDTPPKIHISGEVRENEWIFSVKDNGIGIDPQYFDRIFIIFQRLHKKEDYVGSGIGLAVCKKIVQRHGGKIWVESESGNGSKFIFTIKK